MDRRQFLCSATAAVAAGTLVQRGAWANDEALPIIDTHQHLWDLSKLPLTWVKNAAILNRSFLASDYAEATRGLNIVKTVYMEVAAEPDWKQAEAEQVLAVCREGKTVTAAAVIGGVVDSDGFRAYILRFKGERHLKGVRQILKPAKDGTLRASDSLITGVRLLGELGLCFDLCLPPAFLEEGVRLVDACAGTRIVVDHCGNADPAAFRPKRSGDTPTHDADAWRRGMEALAKRRNTICKISGIISRAEKGRPMIEQLAPIVNHCLDVFGPERVVFGGDWPVCLRGGSVRQWVETLRAIVAGRPIDQRRKLFYDNAAAFYQLA